LAQSRQSARSELAPAALAALVVSGNHRALFCIASKLVFIWLVERPLADRPHRDGYIMQLSHLTLSFASKWRLQLIRMVVGGDGPVLLTVAHMEAGKLPQERHTSLSSSVVWLVRVFRHRPQRRRPL
jgi:hypothetical protein